MSNRRRPPNKPSKALVIVNGTDGELPKSPDFLINFRALIAALDAQVKLWDEFHTLWRWRHKPVDLFREVDDIDDAREMWRQTYAGAERCLTEMYALWAVRWPFEILKIEHSPSAEYLMWRISEMLKKAWLEVKMSEADATSYSEHMAERLIVEGINGLVWENVFRDIEDDPKRKKPPEIAEVLEVLKKTKHNADWKRRLAAVDLHRIQQEGKEMVFALEVETAIFEEAVLEYLDNHKYTDLAAATREGVLSPWECVIEGVAKGEGLSELVAEMESSTATHDLYDKTQQILSDKKHVTLELNLLVKNAQRRLNHDMAFACSKCGAGYQKFDHCKVCGSLVVSHAQWEQHIAYEQQALQTELQIEQQAKLQRLQRAQKRREKSAQPRWQQHYEARTVKTLVSAKRAIDARTKELLQEQAAIQADLDSYYVNGQLK
jgi:hypothetical protein